MGQTRDEITIVDFERPLTDAALVAALVDSRLAEHAESRPGDPLPRPERMAARYAVASRLGEVERTVVGQRGDRVAGFATWEISVVDNPQLVWCHVWVRPDERRHGLGRRLLARALDGATEHGPSEAGFGLGLNTVVGQEIQVLVEGSWGLKTVYTERVGRLVLAEVDRDAMREALDARIGRLRQGFDFQFFAMDDVPPPETGFELTDFVSMVERVCNLMPLEDFQLHPEVYDVPMFHDQVERMRGQGWTIWNYVAIDRATRRSVGMTNVAFDPADPRKIEQWITGVLAESQGHGLGKALKLLMLEKILAEVPGALFIDTDNAVSNAAMVGINTDLGFREHHVVTCYQLPLGRLRELARI